MLSILCVALACAADQPKPDDGRADLTGEWELVAIEAGGKRTDVTKLLAFGGTLTVKGREFRRETGGVFALSETDSGYFKVVSAEKRTFQMETDFTRDRGSDDIHPARKTERSDKELWALVDRDALKVAVAPGKDRPADFTTKLNDGRAVYEYQRVKPKKKE